LQLTVNLADVEKSYKIDWLTSNCRLQHTIKVILFHKIELYCSQCTSWCYQPRAILLTVCCEISYPQRNSARWKWSNLLYATSLHVYISLLQHVQCGYWVALLP